MEIDWVNQQPTTITGVNQYVACVKVTIKKSFLVDCRNHLCHC